MTAVEPCGASTAIASGTAAPIVNVVKPAAASLLGAGRRTFGTHYGAADRHFYDFTFARQSRAVFSANDRLDLFDRRERFGIMVFSGEHQSRARQISRTIEKVTARFSNLSAFTFRINGFQSSVNLEF